MEKKTVYLAGGMRSGWQSLVKALVPGHEYLDPRMHGLREPKDYTEWDLDAIQRADVVFAYFEANNPGGYNLSLELGYAVALGKQTIYIEEPDERGAPRRYTAMLRVAADSFAAGLRDGIVALREMIGYDETAQPTLGDILEDVNAALVS